MSQRCVRLGGCEHPVEKVPARPPSFARSDDREAKQLSVDELGPWIGPKLVCPRFSFECKEHQKRDRADWNQADQHPPAASARIVQPAHAHCSARANPGKHKQAIQNVPRTNRPVNKQKYECEDNVYKKWYPILCALRSSTKICVFSQGLQIPVHDMLPSLVEVTMHR